jgi:hypothetical protein
VVLAPTTALAVVSDTAHINTRANVISFLML